MVDPTSPRATRRISAAEMPVPEIGAAGVGGLDHPQFRLRHWVSGGLRYVSEMLRV